MSITGQGAHHTDAQAYAKEPEEQYEDTAVSCVQCVRPKERQRSGEAHCEDADEPTILMECRTSFGAYILSSKDYEVRGGTYCYMDIVSIYCI